MQLRRVSEKGGTKRMSWFFFFCHNHQDKVLRLLLKKEIKANEERCVCMHTTKSLFTIYVIKLVVISKEQTLLSCEPLH